MGKQVILTLMEGSLEQGLPMMLRIREDEVPAEAEIQVRGKLPPSPNNLLALFNNWQLAYRQMVIPHSRIRLEPTQVPNISCHQLGDELAECLNNWLNSGSEGWQKIRDGLQQNLSKTDEIRVIIQTEDIRLWRLPWHLWDLFSNHYTKAEIALSPSEYKPSGSRTASFTNTVRILAILGDSTGIDIQKDGILLNRLPNVKPTFLPEPQRQDLYDQLWENQWEILFFAGHSSSQADSGAGEIYINQTDSLSIADLKNTLRSSIKRGLQIAIFNSCDGLGLARELADLHIPVIIVMREPVDDLAAQEFLKHFLRSFAEGKSLYLAVREAREKLEDRKEDFPFASWLPVIFQNPAAAPPTWQEMLGRKVSVRNRSIQRLYKLFLLFLMSLILPWLLTTLINNEFPPSLRRNIPENHWKAQYFSNRGLTGSPVFVEDLGEGSQGFSRDWVDGAPSNTPKNNFSALITTKRYFAPGHHLIKVNADDEILVKIGDQTVIDKSINQRLDDFHCNLFNSKGGEYPVKVQYYEHEGNARLNLDIQPYKSYEQTVSASKCKFEERVSTSSEWNSTFFQWDKNQPTPPVNFYKNETNKLGTLNLGSNQRSDGKPGIQKNWGTGSPKDHWGIPTNFFAVRSYTNADFDKGKTYRVRIKADDGFQLLAKHQSLPDSDPNQWVYITPKDQWQHTDGVYKDIKFTVPNDGRYDFHFHLYKKSENAYIDLFWQEI